MSKIEKEAIRVRNEAIKARLIELCVKYGSLFFHLSGEGKVSFNQEGHHSGFIHQSIDGDLGCLFPNKDHQVSARERMFDRLRKLNCVPHNNQKAFEDVVPSNEQWLKFLEDFDNEILDNTDKKEWTAKLTVKGEVVITLRAEAISNTFVTTALLTMDTATYVTQIEKRFNPSGEGHAQVIELGPDPKWSFAVMDGQKRRHVIDQDNCMVYTDRGIPFVGDHLLHDPERKCYIVINEDDYIPVR